MNRAHWPGRTGSPAQGVVGGSLGAYGEASPSKSRAHRPGGDGGPAQEVVGVSFKAYGEPSPSKNRTHRPWGDGGAAQGVVGVPCRAHGKAPSSENRAHRPGGDRESSPGGGRSLPHGPRGGVVSHEPGTPARGGRGVQPRGWSEHPSGVGGVPCGAAGEAAVSLVSAHQPWGGGEPRSGAGSNRGAPSGGAYPAVRARQLGGPWTAPCRWPLLCTLRATRSRGGVGPPHQQGPRLGFPAERPY